MNGGTLTPLERWSWAYRESAGLGRSEKFVLLAIAFHDGESGNGCTASVATLAEKSCCSERSVQRALRVLESRGLVFSTPRHGESTIYRVCGDGGVTLVSPVTHHVTPDNVTPDNVTQTRKNIIHPIQKRSSRKKNTPEPKVFRSRWVDLWNEIVAEVPGVPRARVFRQKSEEALVERASELGLSEEDLEAVLRERLPTLCDMMRPRVTLSWLAGGLARGLESLVNGQYTDDALAKEQVYRERKAAAEAAELKRKRDEDEAFARIQREMRAAQ